MNIVSHDGNILQSYQQSIIKEKVTEVNLPKKNEDASSDVEMVVQDNKSPILMDKLNLECIRPLVINKAIEMKREATNNKSSLEFFQEKAETCSIDLRCRSSTFTSNFKRTMMNIYARQLICNGKILRPSKESCPGKLLQDKSTMLPGDPSQNNLNGFELAEEGGLGELMKTGSNGFSSIQVPDFKRLINDCGKMGILHSLLQQLSAGKHRCLIFCQMTKMMDIIEEYLSWMQYSYFRMDGSTQINDRRDMVDEFQKNTKVFIFLLSTRAGGLGITLTGADTVIFYDSDWNPTMDAQATDRAHRIGQTKEVSVYRLITKHTVEENIVKKAKQKENVQSTVYAGGALRADTLKPSEIIEFLADEESDDKKEPGSFIKTKKRGKKAGDKPTDDDKHDATMTNAQKNTSGRVLELNEEDEEKAKEALKLLRSQKHNQNDDDDDPENEFKDLLEDKNFDGEVKFDDEEDNIQLEDDVDE